MQHTDTSQPHDAQLRAEAEAHVQSKLAISQFTNRVAEIDVGDGETLLVPHHIFDVQVMHDSQAGMYVAVCDELGLVTEATTPDALTDAVMELVPEMMKENSIGKPGQHYCVEFTEHQPS